MIRGSHVMESSPCQGAKSGMKKPAVKCELTGKQNVSHRACSCVLLIFVYYFFCRTALLRSPGKHWRRQWVKTSDWSTRRIRMYSHVLEHSSVHGLERRSKVSICISQLCTLQIVKKCILLSQTKKGWGSRMTGSGISRLQPYQHTKPACRLEKRWISARMHSWN